jgi:rhamnose transport system substrate-binding protein
MAFLPKQLNNPYTDVVLGDGETGAKEAGFESQVLGPLAASGGAQIPFSSNRRRKRAPMSS